jgi:hypothetical protein
VEIALGLAKDTLTELEKDTLGRLDDHFNGIRKQRRTNKRSESDGDITENGDDKPASAGGWKRVRSMKALFLPPAVKLHLSTYGTDAHEFLNSVTATATDHQISAFVDPLKSGDALMARCAYAKKCKGQKEVIEIQLAFCYLFFYDLVKLICPTATGNRVGHNQVKRIREFLKPLLRSENLDDNDASSEVDGSSDSSSTTRSPIIEFTAEELNEWCQWGSKLDTLCCRHGEGVIFFLADKLSQDL